MLTKYIDLLPEEEQEAFKADIAKAVFVNTKEDAERFVESNPLLKAINQGDRDRRLADAEKKWREETLPKLLEAEKEKGKKSPLELQVEQLLKENEAAKREALIERQKNRAIAKANEIGVPIGLIDKYVGITDDETDEGLRILSETLLPWREGAVKKELEKYGSQKAPVGGATGGVITRDSLQTPEGRKAMLEAAKSGAPLQIQE